jgi:hypothetical protein
MCSSGHLVIWPFASGQMNCSIDTANDQINEEVAKRPDDQIHQLRRVSAAARL